MAPTILNEARVVAWTLAWAPSPERPVYTLVAKVTFAIDVAAGTTTALEQPASPRGEANPEEDTGDDGHPSDYALIKPRADVVVCGHAHGRGRTTSVASVGFGHRKNRFERRIAVFGDRTWERHTTPKRLTSVPMRYVHAFGGPGHPLNPVGVGFGDRGRDAPLPNFEDPDRLVTAPSDTALPACFAAVPALWPQRWRKLGTFDERWQATRWPELPEDLDPTFFQAAPPAQQLDHLRGDEPFEIGGMHAEHAVVSGSLAGLVARAFLVKRAGAEPSELKLALDTVVFDLDALEVSLAFRGLLPRASAPDDATIAVVLAPIGDDAAALAQVRALLSPVEEVPEEAGPDPRALAIRQQLALAGVPGGWFDVALLPVLPPPSLDEIDTQLAKSSGDKTVRPLLTDLRTHADRAQEKRRHAIEQLAAHASLAGADLSGADLSGLDLSAQRLDGTDLSHANLRGARLDGASLCAARLAGADLSDASASGADFTGADLVGASLVGATLGHATLEAADLGAVRAERARFDGARGKEARFTEGDFRGVSFDGAELEAADFSAASLDGATFAGAKLALLRLYDAHGTVSFADADLRGARAEQARLSGSSFRNAIAPRAVFDGADLRRVDFRGARLEGACLNDTLLSEASLSAAQLGGAQLRRADLEKASLLQANLMEATLEEARLVGADLRRANLTGAETWKADLSGAKLTDALVHRTKLAGAP